MTLRVRPPHAYTLLLILAAENGIADKQLSNTYSSFGGDAWLEVGVSCELVVNRQPIISRVPCSKVCRALSAVSSGSAFPAPPPAHP